MSAPAPTAGPEVELIALLAYALAAAAGAMVGAFLSFLSTPSRRQGTLVLGFASGVMLGAAFLHMLPEAAKLAGPAVYPWALLGLCTLFVLERYVLVHIHDEEEDGGHEGHDHAHPHAERTELGLSTFLALCAHTLVDGLALASAIGPGLGRTVFVALVVHKVPSAVSLASILQHEGYSRRRVLGMCAFFAAMLPVGTLLYWALRNHLDVAAFTPRALAFSAGTFLHLAVGEFLPEVGKRQGLRRQASLALVAGVALMAALGLLGEI